ncbi:hypothetical protein [Planomonospora sp. ID82291]|uniref:hypothetical protein n=1 Tax=Planomonospora sp. ID82291 TaxID=2738136 RepID=UPI0018C3DD2D|nr:hypothetical protein [Planomonospora sp. ID82291]MBG0819148.1 hypothetical protein [Planomonospora sp. ID82291]
MTETTPPEDPRSARRSQLNAMPKLRLIDHWRKISGNGETAVPLSRLRKDEVVALILDIEFPPLPERQQ